MTHRLHPRRRVLGFAMTLTVSALTFGSVALAQAPAVRGNGPVTAEVMVLHATQSDGGVSIDPRIGNMPQLTKPPFSAYNQYKLLDRKALPLEKGKPAAYVLPNGRTLQVSLVDVVEKRFHVSAAINQPGGQAFLKLLDVTAAPNEPFFVGGQSYQGGTLVLGITLKP
jgi:hypothetical protein